MIDPILVGAFLVHVVLAVTVAAAAALGVWALESFTWGTSHFSRATGLHHGPLTFPWTRPIVIRIVRCQPTTRPAWNIWVYTRWGSRCHNFSPYRRTHGQDGSPRSL